MNNKRVSLILRIALAFSFIYAAISAFTTPNNWVGFIPDFLPGNFITYAYYLTIFSVIEIALGLWLLSNKKVKYAAIVSAIVLAGITVFNLGAIDIVFRDVSLFLVAVALIFLSKD
jgi:uncharacterized membrane protein